MSKRGKLTSNVFLFSLSSFGTKFLSFFLVPLYTNCLSTAEYGTIDLVVNTVALLLPIFTLTIYDGVMRFTLTDKDNKGYFRFGLAVTCIGAILLALLLCVAHSLFPNEINGRYIFIIWILFLCNALYSIITNFLRAVDMVAVMVQGSLINSALLLILNILFIAKIKLGVDGYFGSTIIALLIAIAYMLIRYHFIVRSRQQTNNLTLDHKMDLIKYSIPLIFNAIAWWINSSLDRYFVTGLCGVEANGIYSIAYKIPNLLVAVQTVFTQAWAISAVTEFDSKDTDGFMGHTYELFVTGMTIASMLLILINNPLSKVLYAKEFYAAWRYVPFLLTSTFFGSVAGYYGGIFAAVKDSKTPAVSTMMSAIVNAGLNYLLIPLMGIQGAAIATLLAYFASWLIRAMASRKYIILKYSRKKEVVTLVALFIQVICSINDNRRYYIQIILLLLVIIINKNILTDEMKLVLSKVKNKLFGDRRKNNG